MIASWIELSRRRATNREPEPGEHDVRASIAFGRRDHDPVVEVHVGTLDEFVAERTPVWTELEQLVDSAGSKPSRLGADGVRRLGTTYRATAADLAIARRQFPGDPLVGRLERLVQRARSAVYHTASRRRARCASS